MMNILNGLSAAIDWMETDDRAGMIYVSLAFLLLLELSFRVIRRFFSDLQIKRAVAESSQRVNTRRSRTPSA
jgi:hypothetical protein